MTPPEFNNPQLEMAFNFAEYTGSHIFLTGKAGTGKTTFLHNLKKNSSKRMIVVAPTGVAAINAGGVTIHSFFQMPFGPHLPEEALDASGNDGNENRVPSRAKIQKFNRTKINIIKSLDLLVIDEVSMVRADLLDGIDEVLRRYKDRSKPFGGLQLLMIGDLHQLSPIVKDNEWNLLKDYYDTLFFFGSRALQKTDYVRIELKTIFRQNDTVFINMLNKVRENRIDVEILQELNQKYIPDFSHQDNEGYIHLTTHNNQARQINTAKLKTLSQKAWYYEAEVTGDFPNHAYPTDFELVLKKGAQVMFVKNDISSDKLFYNGKIGNVKKISEDTIYVQCPGDFQQIAVKTAEWKNTKYTIDQKTAEIQETVAGTFKQYPLKLAWAITIHKSQGLTFEKAIIDANAAFAHGQVYVALSRCKSLDGLVLSTPLSNNCIKCDSNVLAFNRDIEQNPAEDHLLNQSRLSYQHALLKELFEFAVLQRQVFYSLKIIKDNKGSIPTYLADNLHEMNRSLKNDIVSVSEKFDNQINWIVRKENSVEDNPVLQERVQKGCVYFIEKTTSIIEKTLQNLSLEIDNKVVKKALNDALSRLKQDTDIKLTVLHACSTGFSVKKYLETRARARIETPKKEKKVEKISTASAPASIAHPELYAQLKSWRQEQADEKDLALYMVLPNKTMIELTTHLPKNTKELKQVKGIGIQKQRQFGKAILSIISDYLKDRKD